MSFQASHKKFCQELLVMLLGFSCGFSWSDIGNVVTWTVLPHMFDVTLFHQNLK